MTISLNSDLLFTGATIEDDHLVNGWRSSCSYSPGGAGETTLDADVYSKAGITVEYVDQGRNAGTKGLRVALTRDRYGDNNYRAGLNGQLSGVNQQLTQHVERWFAMSIFVPPDYELDSQQFGVMFQTHTTGSAPVGTSPALGVYQKNGRWFLRNKYSDDGSTFTIGDDHYFGAPIVGGAWYDFAVRYVMDNHVGGDAETEIFLNGQRVLYSTDPNASLRGDLSEDVLYWNLENYKAPWSQEGNDSDITTTEYIYAAIKFGDSSETLESMSPSDTNPAPPRGFSAGGGL